MSMTMRSSPNAMPPCGGAPSRNARSIWPNIVLLLLFVHAEHAEHFRLQIRLVNSNAAAADFDAVQDDVVGFRADFAEFLFVEQARCRPRCGRVKG